MKPFRVMNTCEECGHQTPAETAFGRWMRACPKLQTNVAYLVRTDTDHFILKFKTHYQGREFQLMMLIETKEHGSEPDGAQRDILNFINQLCYKVRRNLEDSKCYPTFELFSTLNKKTVNVRYMGYHLLQFEKTSPYDSKWIKWDRKEISVETLEGILALDLYPDPPYKPMDEYLRDRHKQHRQTQTDLFVDHIKPTRPISAPTQMKVDADEIQWEPKY